MMMKNTTFHRKVKEYCSPLLPAVLCYLEYLGFKDLKSRACFSVRITIPEERIRIGTEGGPDLDRIGRFL